MDIIIGNAQSGKTTALIKRSAETGATIVCVTGSVVKRVQDKAAKLSLEIPTPISHYDLLKIDGPSDIKAILIDDADELLRRVAMGPTFDLSIDAIAMSGTEKAVSSRKVFSGKRTEMRVFGGC